MSRGPWEPPTNPLLLLADLEEESAAHLSQLARIAGHKAMVYRTQAKSVKAKTPTTPPAQRTQGDDHLLQQVAVGN